MPFYTSLTTFGLKKKQKGEKRETIYNAHLFDLSRLLLLLLFFSSSKLKQKSCLQLFQSKAPYFCVWQRIKTTSAASPVSSHNLCCVVRKRRAVTSSAAALSTTACLAQSHRIRCFSCGHVTRLCPIFLNTRHWIILRKEKNSGRAATVLHTQSPRNVVWADPKTRGPQNLQVWFCGNLFGVNV